MKKSKRIIVILLAVILITANVGGIAFASEAVTPLQENLTYDSENNSTDQTGTQVTTTDATAEEADFAEDAQTADGLLSLDGYEIFVDEQGQVFYQEKEPAETVIIDSKEEEPTPEQETKKESAATKPSYSEKDLRLLASLVYSEAGNQSYKGMLAVANIVLNRMKSPVYSHSNTVKEVIYDKKWSVQFAVTIKSKKTGLSMLDKALNSYDTGKFAGSNPEAEKKAMNKAIKAAKAALQGENNIGNYLCFNAVNRSTSRIKKNYPDHKIIGDHIFYRTK